MKSLFTLIFLSIALSLDAQSIADFEDIALPDTFLNGSDGNGGFASGNVFLPNSYNTMFSSWTGWAISRDTDTTTPGFMNQYSAITGQGMDSSSNYAVFFSSSPGIMELRNEAAGAPVPGFYITNTTYTYLSLRDGDQFAKKFGGVTGDDPDFYVLTIKSYANGMISTDSVDFYLADYRFEDNSQDYIVDEWTYVDLSSLGNADSLWFKLNSSDTSSFGFNTPAYFCVDNIGDELTTGLFSARQPQLAFSLYPNPAQEFIAIQDLKEINATFSIYTLDGKVLQPKTTIENGRAIDIQQLPAGAYLLRVESQSGSGSKIFMKR